MTQAEEGSIFHPWGGGIRELCERGFLCGTVSEEKAFRLCPAFTPMEEQDALLEQTRRYFTNYGPASVRDAAYYFGTSQAEIKKRLARLPVEAAKIRGAAAVQSGFRKSTRTGASGLPAAGGLRPADAGL